MERLKGIKKLMKKGGIYNDIGLKKLHEHPNSLITKPTNSG
jgi:hypothetical protein